MSDNLPKCALIVIENYQGLTGWMDKTALGLVSEFLNQQGLIAELDKFLSEKEREEMHMSGEPIEEDDDEGEGPDEDGFWPE